MYQTGGILFLVFLFFNIKFFLFNILGPFWTPNTAILLIVFFDLISGIRYSLATAVLCGILEDSFSTGLFGINIFAYIASAYVTNIVKKYIYHRGSQLSRCFLVFVVLAFYLAIQTLLMLMYETIQFWDVVSFVIFPEIFTTLLITTFTFNQLRRCASRYLG